MRKSFFAFLLLFTSFTSAQAPEKWSSSEIYQNIKKLNFLGSVLYIAAHPDDENTRLISYFSNERNARTAYLSITRGDGGQNLIGPELREQLGIIRTQELLAARKIDGGKQFFTRANDFGYSKAPSETLNIWTKNEVLGDVVWIIRKFRPDVIINRFDHRTPGSTHGHHTSSAILSVEAFDLAGDPSAYPEQLKYVKPYQPHRLYFNTSPWFYGGDQAFEEADKSNFISFDTGTYFPLKGLSNPEIASLSRSQHRSQGFGSTGSRGEQIEYLELLMGERPKDGINVFSGIDTSWNRIKGGKKIGEILKEVEQNFNFEKPDRSIPGLLEAYRYIDNLEDGHWRETKLNEIKEIIYAASGLYLEAVANSAYATPGEKLQVQLEAINRSDVEVILNTVDLTPNNSKISPQVNLTNNDGWNAKMNFSIPENANYTSPYWLRKNGSMGMYKVDDQLLRGLPETPLYTKAGFKISMNGQEIAFEKPIVYKYNDEVLGETYRNFEIVPPVSISFPEEVLIFNNGESKNIQVRLTAHRDSVAGELKMIVGEAWEIEPIKSHFKIPQSGGSSMAQFKITPPGEPSEVRLQAEVLLEGKTYSQEVVRIEYEHFPNQNLLAPASLKLVKLKISKKGDDIGYIEGAGDVVAESLEQIGYKVSKLNPTSISAENLKKFDAVVLGVRAYNVNEALKFKQPELMEYIKQGGNLIVQYNTSRGLLLDKLAPYALELSRDRVTDETAEVSFLQPDHPVLNEPNKIVKQDFEGWVQERGLYFPNSWGEEFTSILGMSDKNEERKNGSLLVAKYGEGYFIYTGLSFFRQFPEAVPGAFRLFANLISIGK